MWTVNSYTVTWNVDGNKTTEQFAYGATITLPEVPTKFGHTFTAWDGYTNNMTMPAGDVEFEATWNRNLYNITFNPNGGTEKAYTQSFTYGDTVNLTANAFTRVGYHFIGWSTTIDNTVEYVNEAAIVDALVQLANGDKIALYAVWEINTYDVAYDTNGGTGNTDGQSFKHNELVFAHNEIPVKPGYTFAGWQGSDGKTYNAGAQIVAGETWSHGDTLTLTAQWTPNVYQVSFVVGYADGVAPDTQDVTFNGTYGVLPVPTRTGYTFAGWYTDETHTVEVTKDSVHTTVGNTALYAKWEPAANQYTIEYYEMDPNGNYGESWKTETITQDVKTGDSVSASYEAGTGFEVDTQNSVLTGTVAADGSTVLKVYLKRQKFTVTWDVDGSRTIVSTSINRNNSSFFLAYL